MYSGWSPHFCLSKPYSSPLKILCLHSENIFLNILVGKGLKILIAKSIKIPNFPRFHCHRGTSSERWVRSFSAPTERSWRSWRSSSRRSLHSSPWRWVDLTIMYTHGVCKCSGKYVDHVTLIIYICVCVCVCIYLVISSFIYLFVCLFIYLFIYVCVCVHACMHACMYVCINTYGISCL